MYTTQKRVESFLERELTDHEASYIDDLIAQVSEYIEKYTGREWLEVDVKLDDDAEETPRTFDGTGSKELFVDDFTGLEKIEILDSQGNVFTTFEAETDWQTYPLNKDSKNSIRLYANRFPSGSGNIRITALWGGGVTPGSVVMAATAITAKSLLKRKSSTSQFKRESIEGYSYEIVTTAEHDEDVKKILLTLPKRIML